MPVSLLGLIGVFIGVSGNILAHHDPDLGQRVGLAAKFSLHDRNFMAAIIEPLKSHPAKIRTENFNEGVQR